MADTAAAGQPEKVWLASNDNALIEVGKLALQPTVGRREGEQTSASPPGRIQQRTWAVLTRLQTET